MLTSYKTNKDSVLGVFNLPSSISCMIEMSAAYKSPEDRTSSHDMACRSAREGAFMSWDTSLKWFMLQERRRERDQYDKPVKSFEITFTIFMLAWRHNLTFDVRNEIYMLVLVYKTNFIRSSTWNYMYRWRCFWCKKVWNSKNNFLKIFTWASEC